MEPRLPKKTAIGIGFVIIGFMAGPDYIFINCFVITPPCFDRIRVI